jgi:hypothetical protein
MFFLKPALFLLLLKTWNANVPKSLALVRTEPGGAGAGSWHPCSVAETSHTNLVRCEQRRYIGNGSRHERISGWQQVVWRQRVRLYLTWRVIGIPAASEGVGR